MKAGLLLMTVVSKIEPLGTVWSAKSILSALFTITMLFKLNFETMLDYPWGTTSSSMFSFVSGSESWHGFDEV